MRGKLSNNAGYSLQNRNIPAYAGKTHQQTNTDLTRAGTFPRMRGKPPPTNCLNLRKRNIPAYAGKTLKYGRYAAHIPEHPRVCGENSPPHNHHRPEGGTSPRMRGKPMRNTSPNREERNIPAYAGKTRRRPVWLHVSEEHPRVCGENGDLGGVFSFGVGTSPRMRGKLRPAVRWRLRPGNIPAYAGKTWC